jgi:hypothetical protein
VNGFAGWSMWAAETHRLPSSFLTRVLWLESGFRTVCENGSTEAVAAENRDAYRRIGLRLAVSSEYAAIVKLLGSIDTAPQHRSTLAPWR